MTLMIDVDKPTHQLEEAYSLEKHLYTCSTDITLAVNLVKDTNFRESDCIILATLQLLKQKLSCFMDYLETCQRIIVKVHIALEPLRYEDLTPKQQKLFDYLDSLISVEGITLVNHLTSLKPLLTNLNNLLDDSTIELTSDLLLEIADGFYIWGTDANYRLKRLDLTYEQIFSTIKTMG